MISKQYITCTNFNVTRDKTMYKDIFRDFRKDGNEDSLPGHNLLGRLARMERYV